ncbi:MAG: PilZ domain-containing protein [Opitutaceae bacterium]|nr:PilZ domain-containing protein [Opitutaceae bacterium]
MLFFKRILNFKRDAMARLRDKRRARRYPVGPGFALKASVNLAGIDDPARIATTPVGLGREWAGHLSNLSSGGVSVQLPPAAMTLRGERTVVKLALEHHRLEIPCVVAHFRVLNSVALCGLSLKFPDFTAQKAYLQLLAAVRLGSSFEAGPARRGRHNPAGTVREEYQAENRTRLTAWRDTSSRELHSFELMLDDHCLRGRADSPTLDVYTRQRENKTAPAAVSAPTHRLSTGTHAEVRQLFRWVVPNIGKPVPSDLRAFLQRFAHARTDWRPPTAPP